MSNDTNRIIESILSKTIDKNEALRNFESLSEKERNDLLAKLKSKLVSGDVFKKSGQKKLLKVVSERALGEMQEAFIQKLTKDFGEFAKKSKAKALKHQYHFVDQRKITNLKRGLKSIQFHITYDKAEGAYLYDIDGNKYVDITGDNGVNIFGHQAPFIKKEIEKRLNKGFPLVGYTEELFKAAELFCEITGHERVLFTQSGTEAVMWAVRIARAASNRKKVVIFDGSYHGLSDTVMAMRDLEGNSLAPAPGMVQEFADQLIILEYGNMNELDIIEERAHEIGAVLVEPVQSRNPMNQPREFLHELRKITLEKDIPLIFDEMITGFRAGSKGAQGFFNVNADIATYGKIPGGGMPTGMIAGLAKYMDYVDGGTWNFDDDSMPSMKRTLMAGTHTRNPLKIAASMATLKEIKKRCQDDSQCKEGSCFHGQLNAKTKAMAQSINRHFEEERIPVTIEHFSSLFRVKFLDDPNGVAKEIFFVLLRMNGVETSVSGNYFLTTEHSNKDIETIISAFKKSADTLKQHGFFYESDEEYVEATSPIKTVSPKAQKKISKQPVVIDPQIEKLKALIRADLKNFQEEGY